MRLIWEIHSGWPDAVDRVCNAFRVVISTVDTAMKAVSRLLSTPVVSRLLKMRPLGLQIVDEVQRCRAWQLFSLMLHAQTAVWVGDQMQKLPNIIANARFPDAVLI